MKIVPILIIMTLLSIGCQQKNQESTAEPFKNQMATVERCYNEKYGKPIIVYTFCDPFEWELEAKKPRFVMYEKGQIIYQLKTKEGLKFMEVTLSKQELSDVIESFNISDEFYSLDSCINVAPGILDLPTNTLIIDFKFKKKCNIYGNLKSLEMRKNTPGLFVDIYDKIIGYKNAKAKVWSPPQYEVYLFEDNNAPKKRKWIEGFPDLNSYSTKKKGLSSFIVYIDSSRLNEFLSYYNTFEEDEMVEINGRNMSISYGVSFPNIK